MVSTIAPSLRRRALLIGLGVLASAGTARAQSIGDLLWPPQSLEEMALRIERTFPRACAKPRRPTLRNSWRHRASLFCSTPASAANSTSAICRALNGFRRMRLNRRRLPRLARARDRVVIFYCSVGQRSSRMADEAGPALRGRGARAIYNLRGGVFAWHDEARPLVDAFGSTPYVHPFSGAWGRLLSRPDLARMQPRSRP
jgi:rhodanese-related sulfurtransferase